MVWDKDNVRESCLDRKKYRRQQPEEYLEVMLYMHEFILDLQDYVMVPE